MTKIDPTVTKPARSDRSGDSTQIDPTGDGLVDVAPHPSVRLLVSVRERSELLVALASGVDIIDLKEPRLGALSPVEPGFWRESVNICNEFDPGCVPVRGNSGWPRSRPALSAALGEPDEADAIADQLPPTFQFAKVGPSGCDSVDKLRRVWHRTRNQLHDDIELVAVSYADHARAHCIAPEQVFKAASEFGLQTCLIDTFVKDGQSTLDLLGLDGVRRISEISRHHQLRWTLAGSVRVGVVANLRSAGLSPDCIGVRGDVCREGRTGTLVADRIEVWKHALRA